jgi:serine/threonine protein kinase
VCFYSQGAFGVVAEAIDTQTGRKVAIKVVKAHKRFTEHAQLEIELLNMLRDTGSSATKHIGARLSLPAGVYPKSVLTRSSFGTPVHLLDSFMHGDHQCLVFELLGPNLYDIIKQSKFKGLSFKVVRKFAKQILTVQPSPNSCNHIHP